MPAFTRGIHVSAPWAAGDPENSRRCSRCAVPTARPQPVELDVKDERGQISGLQREDARSWPSSIGAVVTTTTLRAPSRGSRTTAGLYVIVRASSASRTRSSRPSARSRSARATAASSGRIGGGFRWLNQYNPGAWAYLIVASPRPRRAAGDRRGAVRLRPLPERGRRLRRLASRATRRGAQRDDPALPRAPRARRSSRSASSLGDQRLRPRGRPTISASARTSARSASTSTRSRRWLYPIALHAGRSGTSRTPTPTRTAIVALTMGDFRSQLTRRPEASSSAPGCRTTIRRQYTLQVCATRSAAAEGGGAARLDALERRARSTPTARCRPASRPPEPFGR